MNPRVNERITSAEVFLIDDKGNTYGKVSRDQAIYIAYQNNTDLVEISPSATPPVAKLIDWGKFQYEMQKKSAKQRAKQKTSELKEVRLSLKINDHDLQTKARKADKFLKNGDKVRVTVILKGRENIFPDQAIAQINKFSELINGESEQRPVRTGNRISTIINKQKQDAEN